MKKIIFGEHEIPCATDMSIAEAKDWAAQAIPGLSEAEGREDTEGNYVFTKKAGVKGK